MRCIPICGRPSQRANCRTSSRPKLHRITDSTRVELLPLIPDPDKVLCVGVNYRPHIEEMGRASAGLPRGICAIFRQPGGAWSGGDKPGASEQYDFEGELAIVIGKSARHVTAMRHLTTSPVTAVSWTARSAIGRSTPCNLRRQELPSQWFDGPVSDDALMRFRIRRFCR